MPETTTAVPAIELRDATAVSGEYEVFKRLSVAFPEGATTVILGSTGSGKSSLIKMAAGLLPPAEGVVLFRGQDMGRFGRKDLSLAAKLAASIDQPVPITDFVFEQTKHA
ncbi:MAG TPA: ABC transporter ATP-binding protein [Spirochaetales bacterium]|nr:ABC transporter ATP-binding protein [Spirochaetales bacterium]